MSERARTIQLEPGILINLVTRLEGGVEYRREELGGEVMGDTERTEWSTERRVASVSEHAAAVQVRGRVRSMIRSACIWTQFGMICLAAREAELDERIVEAHAMVDTFNLTAVHTRVRFPEPLRGRIAEDSRQAVAAIREEIHTLVGEMQAAVAAGEVATIRDVAQKATQMGRLLGEGTEARTALERAVKESRRIASELVKRLEEGAEATAQVLASCKAEIISTARQVFAEDELGEITDVAPSLGAGATQRFGDLGEDYVEPVAPPEPEEPAPAVGEVAPIEGEGSAPEPPPETPPSEPEDSYDEEEI